MSIEHLLPPPLRQEAVVVVRPARDGDRAAIRRVVRDAYAEYADRMPRAVHRRYLADLLDLDRHASDGVRLVAEVEARVCGTAVFYPDASLQGLGWPAGWAGGRGLAVRREARHLGVARRLIAACEGLARTIGAPAFAFHTAPFMTRALALYEGLGFDRAPAYDLEIGDLFGVTGHEPIRVMAFMRDLTPATTPSTPAQQGRAS